MGFGAFTSFLAAALALVVGGLLAYLSYNAKDTVAAFKGLPPKQWGPFSEHITCHYGEEAQTPTTGLLVVLALRHAVPRPPTEAGSLAFARYPPKALIYRTCIRMSQCQAKERDRSDGVPGRSVRRKSSISAARSHNTSLNNNACHRREGEKMTRRNGRSRSM